MHLSRTPPWQALEYGYKHPDDLLIYERGSCMVAVWEYHHDYRI